MLPNCAQNFFSYQFYKSLRSRTSFPFYSFYPFLIIIMAFNEYRTFKVILNQFLFLRIFLFLLSLIYIFCTFLLYFLYQVLFFLFIHYLKSMKFFLLSSAIFLTFTATAMSDCGDGAVFNRHRVCVHPHYIDGCLQYESSQACAQCEPGYKLNKNHCDSIEFLDRPPKIVGCLKKSSDGKFCQNCSKDFVKRNGSCQIGIINCQKYKEDKSCAQCKKDYSLVLGQCRYNFILGCKKIKGDHSCQECWAPFILKDNHCQVPNCQSLNDYGCTTCACGFYLNKDRGCQKAQDGCLRYERGRCINCLNHYRLKGGICQIEGCVKYEGNFCTDCKKEYERVNGGCSYKNCNDWSNDQCISCKAGFKNSEGVCTKVEDLICKD